MEELAFESLEPIEVKVNLGGNPAVLVEASGDAHILYDNFINSKTRRDADGNWLGLDPSNDVIPLVLSKCLFTDNGEGRKPVPEAVIRSWRGNVMSQLWAKLRAISPGLVPEPEDEESLTQLISKLQERLAKVRAGKTAQGQSKN